MTREEAKQLLPIIQAYAEGKTVQLCERRRSTCLNCYVDLGNNVHFDTYPAEYYRIKPEHKYRPFKDAEECWQEMKNHQPFGWVKCKVTGNKYLVSCIESDYSIFIVGDVENRTLRGFYTNFTFADGTPFGIKEGTDD